MSKNRHFDVAGGPAHYRRIRHRLLNPQAQSHELGQGNEGPEALGIVSEPSDSEPEPDHDSGTRSTRPHGSRSRPRPPGHALDVAPFATSMPVRVPGLANTYRVTKEERDYIINRQLYASTYYQSLAITGERASGRGRSATAVANPNSDDWDPITGAHLSPALSAVEESDHDEDTRPSGRHHQHHPLTDDSATTTTEATAAAIPMTYGRPRFSQGRTSHGSTNSTHHDALFRGAQSFIPPHELAAMSYAADTNNLFGSKPPDVFRGRMNI
ncbi:hypothetical protein H4R35_004610 [Dimargaris xerosporica]|nr:hypothetical protein H4R35_004610 [Dimargaris xerosporica]